jgi:imidazolonepropionase-like amidohydrolase
MRKLFLPLVIVVTLPIGEAPIAAQRTPAKLALVGGMLLDGYEVPPTHHAVVLIEGDKIVAKGRMGEVTIPPDARVIDTSGRTMLPGLIDLHVHTMILGHGDYGRWFPWILEQNLVEEVMTISVKQLLMAGVTSAIDLASPLKESIRVRDRINKGEIPGPRMWMSGPWITRQVGNYPPGMFEIKAETAEQAAAAAESLVRAGVDVIKVYPLAADQYQSVVAVARKHGKRVHAHVGNSPQSVRDAMRAGVDVLTHVATRPPYDDDLMREIVDTGQAVSPTAALRFAIYPATVAFPERLQDPRLKQDFPPKIYAEVQDSFKNFHALGYFQNMERINDFVPASLRRWVQSAALIGMGTDSGTPMNFHTEALWREMKLFVDYGMSPQRAISSATRINARILGRGRDLGTIEPGKLADIIVVNGNPLFDITALGHVEVVIKDGVVVKGATAASGGRGSLPAK